MAHRQQMLYFKSCPRCQGDMYLDSDYYGTYKQCLQCGCIVDLEKQAQEKVASHADATIRAA